jgi:hypothetical protein
MHTGTYNKVVHKQKSKFWAKGTPPVWPLSGGAVRGPTQPRGPAEAARPEPFHRTWCPPPAPCILACTFTRNNFQLRKSDRQHELLHNQDFSLSPESHRYRTKYQSIIGSLFPGNGQNSKPYASSGSVTFLYGYGSGAPPPPLNLRL